jgi:predicted PurR-regulated permease PerM
LHIDKKILRNIFFIAGGCVVLAWILLHPEQLGAVSSYIWGLISPFVVGAAIAFVFNVPMRSIERFLEGIKRPGLRRTLAILLTLGALVIVIAFVFELLVPQINATVESLVATIPQFVRRTVETLMKFLEENPEIQEWVLANTELASIDWTALLQKAGSFVGNSVSTIADRAFGAITNVAGAIVDLVISIVFSIYCLASKEVLARQARRITYSVLSEKTGDEVVRIMRLTNSTFYVFSNLNFISFIFFISIS